MSAPSRMHEHERGRGLGVDGDDADREHVLRRSTSTTIPRDAEREAAAPPVLASNPREQQNRDDGETDRHHERERLDRAVDEPVRAPADVERDAARRTRPR